VRSGGSSVLFSLAALAFAACSIDLSALQRTDAGFNPAIDPDAAAAGSAGTGGTGGSDAGPPTAGTSGMGAAQSGTGSAGEPSKNGESGKSSSPPVAGADGGAGAPAPVAGSSGSSPPPPPAAGAPALEPEPTGNPPKTCGLPGLPCCTPGSQCDVGACLRGKCTPYGGYYGKTEACSAAPCTSRNAYTAGCVCPSGFTDTLLWQELRACDAGGSGVTEVRSCTAGRTPGIAFGGAWVQGPDGNCTISCLAPNPLTGQCTCPAGTAQVSMNVDIPIASCPNAETTLQMCTDGAGKPVNFGGAYAVSQTASFGCGAANPLTDECSCPEGATTPQSLHVGSWSIFVCNL